VSSYAEISAADLSNPESALFFQNVYQAFSDAEQSTGATLDRYYMIGGFTVRLRFAGSSLIPIITPPLAHLSIEPVSEPSLTICLSDSSSTKITLPPIPWDNADYLQFGLINGFNSKDIKILHNRALHIIDLSQNIAIYWISDTGSAPYYHSITPLRTILHWWLHKHRQFIIHAAAVGLSDRGVLITGKGGAGKSTTALSCIVNGLKYVGDENCIISNSPEPYAHSLYSSGTLEAEDVDRIPQLYSSLINADRLDVEKAVYYLFNKYQDNLSHGFPVKAVLVPKVSGTNDTIIRKLSAAQTLVALAPGSLFQLPGAGGESFHAMAKLLKQVPCYTLELGTDLYQIPVEIKKFLESLP